MKLRGGGELRLFSFAIVYLVVVSMVAPLAFAKPKHSDWQTGTEIESGPAGRRWQGIQGGGDQEG